MERVELTADQIVVFEGGIHSESILRIYEYLIASGAKDFLPPILVTPIDAQGLDGIRYQSRLRVLSVLGARYILQDGNHKAFAHAIRHEAAKALVLSDEKDLVTCRGMAKRGELPNFPSVFDKHFSVVISRLGEELNAGSNHIHTVSDKIEKAIVDKRAPRDIIKTYQRTGSLSISKIMAHVKYRELALSNTGNSERTVIPKDLRDNKEYLMAGDCIPLDQVSKRLRDDYDVVHKAVEQNSCSGIANASERLRRDRELTEFAVSRHDYAYKYIHPIFRDDKRIAILALTADYSNAEVFSTLPEHLKRDPDVIEAYRTGQRRI